MSSWRLIVFLIQSELKPCSLKFGPAFARHGRDLHGDIGIMPLFSHYGDVADISDRLAIPALVFAILTPLFIVARLWSRRVFAKHIGADDWVILASWVVNYIFFPSLNCHSWKAYVL